MKRRYRVKADSPRAKERDEYLEWQKKHESAHEQAIRKLIPKVKEETSLDYWRAKAAELEARRRDPTVTDEPLPEGKAVGRVSGIDTSNMTLEEIDALEKRERLAQEEIKAKKARTGPLYNKGGAQYLSDDLMKDVKAGTTRRRS